MTGWSYGATYGGDGIARVGPAAVVGVGGANGSVPGPGAANELGSGCCCTIGGSDAGSGIGGGGGTGGRGESTGSRVTAPRSDTCSVQDAPSWYRNSCRPLGSGHHPALLMLRTLPPRHHPP